MPTLAVTDSPTLRRLLASIPALLAGRVPDPHRIREAVARRIGAAALTLIREDFDAKGRGGVGRDGVKWKPRKRRKGQSSRRPILVKSGRLRAALVGGRAGSMVRVSGGKITVGVNESVPYARCHQEGTSRMPARPIVPGPNGMPLAWRRALAAEARKAIAEALATVLARGAVR